MFNPNQAVQVGGIHHIGCCLWSWSWLQLEHVEIILLSLLRHYTLWQILYLVSMLMKLLCMVFVCFDRQNTEQNTNCASYFFFNSQDIKRQSIQIIRATLVLIVPSFQDEMFILNRFKKLAFVWQKCSLSSRQGAEQQATCEGDCQGVFAALSRPAGGSILVYPPPPLPTCNVQSLMNT